MSVSPLLRALGGILGAVILSQIKAVQQQQNLPKISRG